MIIIKSHFYVPLTIVVVLSQINANIELKMIKEKECTIHEYVCIITQRDLKKKVMCERVCVYNQPQNAGA